MLKINSLFRIYVFHPCSPFIPVQLIVISFYLIWFLSLSTYLVTIENHGNAEITEAVIFVKCCDFAKMPCSAVFLAKMPWFYRFLQYFFVFNHHKQCDFNRKIFTFATATKVLMSCFLLVQYVTVTSSQKFVF